MFFKIVILLHNESFDSFSEKGIDNIVKEYQRLAGQVRRHYKKVRYLFNRNYRIFIVSMKKEMPKAGWSLRPQARKRKQTIALPSVAEVLSSGSCLCRVVQCAQSLKFHGFH